MRLILKNGKKVILKNQTNIKKYYSCNISNDD